MFEWLNPCRKKGEEQKKPQQPERDAAAEALAQPAAAAEVERVLEDAGAVRAKVEGAVAGREEDEHSILPPAGGAEKDMERYPLGGEGLGIDPPTLRASLVHSCYEFRGTLGRSISNLEGCPEASTHIAELLKMVARSDREQIAQLRAVLHYINRGKEVTILKASERERKRTGEWDPFFLQLQALYVYLAPRGVDEKKLVSDALLLLCFGNPHAPVNMLRWGKDADMYESFTTSEQAELTISEHRISIVPASEGERSRIIWAEGKELHLGERGTASLGHFLERKKFLGHEVEGRLHVPVDGHIAGKENPWHIMLVREEGHIYPMDRCVAVSVTLKQGQHVIDYLPQW